MKYARLSRPLTILLAIITAVSLVFGTGCYGSFPLTSAVHRVNDTPGNDLVDTVVMWVFLIVPVYEVAILGDAFVLNLLEFWVQGDVSLADGEGELRDGYELRRAGPDRLQLVRETGDGGAVRATFVRVSESRCQVRGPDGGLLGRAVRDGEGRVVLESADGESLHVLRGDRVQACLRGK